MKIHVYGIGDKRIVVYPLLRLLNALDGGVLVTDNGVYRALKPDDSGYVGNVRILHDTKVSSEDLGIYASVISDCWEPPELYDEQWETIWVRKVRHDVEPPNVENYAELYFDFERPIPVKGERKPIVIMPSLMDYRSISDYEVTGDWKPFKPSPALRAISNIVAPMVGLDSKMVSLLMTGKVRGGK